jgi:adenylosuccinate synthase
MEYVSVVIGASYGDEGKGLFTDYLVKNPIPAKMPNKKLPIAVVRFNGGAQAGHTVTTDEGIRHVFHHFGSGTLRGAPTILSRFFVVNPRLFLKEALELNAITDKKISIFVDPDAPITTPFEVYINQEIEKARGAFRHGSCGVGFGETLEREDKDFSLTMYDIASRGIKNKLEKIQNEWLPARLKNLGLDPEFKLPENTIDIFMEDINEFIKLVNIMPDTSAMNLFNHIVFEGAQGLRLDQNSEDFPYVTRSNTGLENVSVLLENYNGEIDVYYISRSYLTRHGAGPLKGEFPSPFYSVMDKTNVPNPYQGTLRFASLDFERMANDVKKDKEHLAKDFNTYGVMTWCNVIGNEILDTLVNNFSNAIDAKNIYLSYSPVAEKMMVR